MTLTDEYCRIMGPECAGAYPNDEAANCHEYITNVADTDTGPECDRWDNDTDLLQECIRKLRKECPSTLDGWEPPLACKAWSECTSYADSDGGGYSTDRAR